MNVSNRGCIRRLSLRALRANRTRNLVAVLAIALTSLLFTALFTIALSINEGIQQNTFRQVGGSAHGGFKYLTQEQFLALKEDSLIQEWGVRRYLGMPTEVPFNKAHVEIGYSDSNQAHWSFCDPIEGRMPREGTQEAATDTRVLELLGIEPELGASFTVTFPVDGRETTQTFTLCGWWEYDPACVASHLLIPESRLEEILLQTGVTPPGQDGITGCWNLDVMLKHGARSIDADLERILQNHGFQSENPEEESTYIRTGVNWGYTGAQFSSRLDPATALLILGMLALILLTGYLIIYNVFRISVAGDIRFYGLLKTIGTTPRQLRRIIRIQALLLALAGIPLGLLGGWLLGGVLTPFITAQLNAVTDTVSVSPFLFAGSACFSLCTVLISCRRPGRMAGKASPIEASRYSDAATGRRSPRQNRQVSLFSMAWANLGRSRGKTALTVLSLSLASLLLTLTVTFTGGFDMDKYISNFTASDFILADAGQFQTSGELFHSEMGIPQDVIETVSSQGGIAAAGWIYGRTSMISEFVTEEYYRTLHSRWYSPQQMDSIVSSQERREGLLQDTAQLYGMDPFAMDYLHVLEGDLSGLYEPGSRCIAAVYSEDEYGQADQTSHWAKLGDTVTLRYVDEYEYYDPATGESYSVGEALPEDASLSVRALRYREEEYTVTALVSVPYAFSYRYYGSDEFVLGSDTFLRDTGTDSVMYYAFDVEPAETDRMEAFLQEYTENENPRLDYESKQQYAAQFAGIKRLFLLLGGALSFVVGLVGILNFFNAILTGITARRRELAVLQAIGMTSRQLQGMLALEGLLYTVSSIVLAFFLLAVTAPFLGSVLNQAIWFFSYRFVLWPLVLLLPLFAALGVLIPLLSCRSARKSSVVERLRQE